MDQTCLIVNADDFGYFSCVSRGILASISSGSVTATGIMANGPDLKNSIRSLQMTDARVDLGVHLNLSLGAPLTPDMQHSLRMWRGRFPGKFTVVAALLSKAISVETVRAEWSAQIERCLELGIKPLFLNSHEHVHMLPWLYTIVRGLATTYRIPYVRHVTSEPLSVAFPRGAVRSFMLAVLSLASDPPDKGTPLLLGLGASGKLTCSYLRRRLSSLRKGQVYELMCHPGYYEPSEIKERRLVAYHDWESELRLLTSPTLQAICAEQGIRLIGYQDLLTWNSGSTGEINPARTKRHDTLS